MPKKGDLKQVTDMLIIHTYLYIFTHTHKYILNIFLYIYIYDVHTIDMEYIFVHTYKQ